MASAAAGASVHALSAHHRAKAAVRCDGNGTKAPTRQHRCQPQPPQVGVKRRAVVGAGGLNLAGLITGLVAGAPGGAGPAIAHGRVQSVGSRV